MFHMAAKQLCFFSMCFWIASCGDSDAGGRIARNQWRGADVYRHIKEMNYVDYELVLYEPLTRKELDFFLKTTPRIVKWIQKNRNDWNREHEGAQEEFDRAWGTDWKGIEAYYQKAVTTHMECAVWADLGIDAADYMAASRKVGGLTWEFKKHGSADRIAAQLSESIASFEKRAKESRGGRAVFYRNCTDLLRQSVAMLEAYPDESAKLFTDNLEKLSALIEAKEKAIGTE